MTRTEEEVMLKREKEKAYVTKICLDLKPPYPAELAAKPYPIAICSGHLEKFDACKGNTRELVVPFLDLMAAFAHNADLCLGEFSKPLNGRMYTWYVNLKPGSIDDWKHLVSLSTSNFWCRSRVFPRRVR